MPQAMYIKDPLIVPTDTIPFHQSYRMSAIPDIQPSLVLSAVQEAVRDSTIPYIKNAAVHSLRILAIIQVSDIDNSQPISSLI